MLSIIEMVFYSSSHIYPRFYFNTYHELPIWVFVISHFHRRQKDRGSGGHYNDVIMTMMASQITSLTVVYSIVYSDADQRKHPNLRVSGLCAGNSPGPVNSPYKGQVTRKMVLFDDVIMVNISGWEHLKQTWPLISLSTSVNRLCELAVVAAGQWC